MGKEKRRLSEGEEDRMRVVRSLAGCLFLAMALFAGTAREATAQESTKSVKFDGARVNYVDYGKGSEALVFVHGWTCNLGFWKDNLPAFKTRTRVLAIDLPGHGASEAPESKLTMDLFAKSVSAVMENAGVRKAVLVGHSMGTPVIRQFYRLYPDKTIAVVLVDGSVKPFVDKQQMDQIHGDVSRPEL